MKAEQERKRRENEVNLQRKIELEKEFEKSERYNKIWKVLGYIVAITVALVIIWELGLLIPLGIIGLIGAFGLKR